MARKLSAKHLRFVERYLATGKATQSYLDAGFQCVRSSARANATRLLSDPRVQELLEPSRKTAEMERAELERGVVITRDRIRLEMARISFFDPRRLFDDAGRLKPVKDLDADTAAALAQFEVTEEKTDDDTTIRVTKVKFWDKNRALQNLADTEPGVWAEGTKGKDSNVNVNVDVAVTKTSVTLTAADLDAVDAILSGIGLHTALEGAADRETPAIPTDNGQSGH